MTSKAINEQQELSQAIRELETRWSGSADALFEAKLKLIRSYLPKNDGRGPQCHTRQVYNQEYDAYFCPACNNWLEEGCDDPACSSCSKRPAKPLPASLRHKARMGKRVKVTGLATVRLPRKFLDEIVARCDRAIRTRSVQLRTALVRPLMAYVVDAACPKRVRRKISDATCTLLFGETGRGIRSRRGRRKLAGSGGVGRRTAKTSTVKR